MTIEDFEDDLVSDALEAAEEATEGKNQFEIEMENQRKAFEEEQNRKMLEFQAQQREALQKKSTPSNIPAAGHSPQTHQTKVSRQPKPLTQFQRGVRKGGDVKPKPPPVEPDYSTIDKLQEDHE